MSDAIMSGVARAGRHRYAGRGVVSDRSPRDGARRYRHGVALQFDGE
jgi:hypothetical protein